MSSSSPKAMADAMEAWNAHIKATLGYGIQTLRNPGLNLSNFGTSDFDASFWRENNPEGSSCKLNVARLWGKLYFSKRKHEKHFSGTKRDFF